VAIHSVDLGNSACKRARPGSVLGTRWRLHRSSPRCEVLSRDRDALVPVVGRDGLQGVACTRRKVQLRTGQYVVELQTATPTGASAARILKGTKPAIAALISSVLGLGGHLACNTLI
jgi:hypothetical protein